MSDLLFDVPWWLPTLIALIGIAIFVEGNRRQKMRLRSTGLGLIALAVSWALVSYFVDTPKEKCQKRTRELVAAVVSRDWSKVNGLLAPDASFNFASSDWHISQDLVQTLQAGVERIGLKSAHVSSMDASQDRDAVIVRFRVYSVQDYTLGEPVDSDWDMTWRANGDQWLLHEIRAVRVHGATTEQVRGALPKH